MGKKSDGPVFFEDPLSGVDREVVRAAIVGQAKKRAVEFPERLEELRKLFRTYSPLDILAITSAYALQTTVTDKEVAAKGLAGPELGQHHIEILQAIALTLDEAEWGQSLPTSREVGRAFELSKELADGFHLRRNAEMERISNTEDMLVRSMQERLRLHTQMVRNWGYFSDVVDISTKLYGRFDPDLKKHFGLTATEIIPLFALMMKKIEGRSTDRLLALRRVFRERKPKAMVRAWYKANPNFEGTADEFIKKFGERLEDRQTVMAGTIYLTEQFR